MFVFASPFCCSPLRHLRGGREASAGCGLLPVDGSKVGRRSVRMRNGRAVFFSGCLPVCVLLSLLLSLLSLPFFTRFTFCLSSLPLLAVVQCSSTLPYSPPHSPFSHWPASSGRLPLSLSKGIKYYPLLDTLNQIRIEHRTPCSPHLVCSSLSAQSHSPSLAACAQRPPPAQPSTSPEMLDQA